MVIIAELGSNPAARGWDFRPYCMAARGAGATHIKIQLWRAEHFPLDEQAAKRPLEFPRPRFSAFCLAARDYGLFPGASVFDAEAVGLAAIQGDFLKLAAREVANHALMEQVIRTGKPYYRSVVEPRHHVYSPLGLTLYTIPQYPTPMPRALWRLLVVRTQTRGIPFGWSSHTAAPGILDCALAARLGAQAIEKHLCLSTDEPEAGHSLRPHEFERMVQKCRQ